jgi:CRP-like cAMP-binding protein
MSEMTIAQVPLFASLPINEIQRLQDTLSVRILPENTVLFKEGDRGDYFYVILDGQLDIIKAQGTPEEHIIATRGPGEFIGEISLLEHDGLRTAGVVVRSAARLLEMTRADFDSLLNRNPMMAYEMVHVLGTRLKASHDAAILDLQEKNRILAKAYDELRANQAQLIEKEKLEHELQVAYEIQISILPQELPEVTG